MEGRRPAGDPGFFCKKKPHWNRFHAFRAHQILKILLRPSGFAHWKEFSEPSCLSKKSR